MSLGPLHPREPRRLRESRLITHTAFINIIHTHLGLWHILSFYCLLDNDTYQTLVYRISSKRSFSVTWQVYLTLIPFAECITNARADRVRGSPSLLLSLHRTPGILPSHQGTRPSYLVSINSLSTSYDQSLPRLPLAPRKALSMSSSSLTSPGSCHLT